MKQRKNAFTLIELLAVIIILAAIALIIAPLVLDIIKEQQMKTFKESINGILRSSRLEIVNSGLKFPAPFTYSDGKLLSPTGKELKVTGKIPEGTGSVIFYSEEKIELAIKDQVYCGTYNQREKEVNVENLNGECNAVAYTAENCFAFDSNTGTITKYNINNQDCPIDVIIPDSIGGVKVKIIGEEAFFDDTSDRGIVSVVLPVWVEEIQTSAFSGIPLIMGFHENNKNEVQLLKNNNRDLKVSNLSNFETGGNAIERIDFSRTTKLKIIGNAAFAWNQLTNVDIPDTVTNIGNSAFCENQLSKVKIGNQVKIIGNNAFSGNMIENIIIPDSVTDIGDYAFASIGLTNLKLGKGLLHIGSDAFAWNQLTNVDISENVISIGEYAFYDNQIKTLTLGNNLETIEKFAFSENKIENLVIPNKVQELTTSSFSDNSIKSLVLGNNITKIGSHSFYENDITKVEIPDSVTIIEGYSFLGNQLEEVKLSKNLTTIGPYAFSYNKLTNIEIPNSVTTIEGSAFEYNQLTSVIIPENVIEIQTDAFLKNKSKNSNSNLTKIVNLTQRSFDWGQVINGGYAETEYNFVTGTVVNSAGNVTVTAE